MDGQAISPASRGAPFHSATPLLGPLVVLDCHEGRERQGGGGGGGGGGGSSLANRAEADLAAALYAGGWVEGGGAPQGARRAGKARTTLRWSSSTWRLGRVWPGPVPLSVAGWPVRRAAAWAALPGLWGRNRCGVRLVGHVGELGGLAQVQQAASSSCPCTRCRSTAASLNLQGRPG